MNIVTSLESMGLVVRIDDAGALALTGLQTLSADERRVAVELVKENRAAIMEELRRRSRLLANVNIADTPTPAQLDHARSLLVDCPSTGGKLHCWHCTRCAKEMKCMAWRHIPAAEMRFQRSAAGKTYSLYLVEAGAVEVLQ